jgi:hypothetical protein
MKKGKIILILAVLVAVVGVTRWYIQMKPASGTVKASEKRSDYYYCPMHPWFHQDHQGNCGICGMTLIKKEGGEGVAMETKAVPKERKVKFWANPMDPSVHSDKPMKDSMGMDYVPVYEDMVSQESGETGVLPAALKGLGQINLSPWKQQLIGLRTAVAEKKPVTRVVRTVGRVAGGPDDFAAAAGDFAAHGRTSHSGQRYVVADVYALDIPYVKVGQKAWVSSFGQTGNRVEGRVVQIYPYDGTQSRVRRVKVGVSNLPSAEIFANVTIEASSQPYLSIPADAVLTTGTQKYVFVEKSPEVFVPVEVGVGFEGDGDWQITSGLSAGETVVVGANFMVDADSKLKANFAAMESQSK